MIALIGLFILLGSLALALGVARRAGAIMEDSNRRELEFLAAHTNRRDES